MSVTTLSLFRFGSLRDLPWVIGQMAFARFPLRRDPRLLFVKLCGSGTGEGFTPRPNLHVWAILAVWKDEQTARSALQDSSIWQAWRKRAVESWTLYLDPTSTRGSWSHVNPFLPDGARAAAPGRVAALTRATVRTRHALRFWNRVPAISAVIGADPNILFKIGIGEVPLLHQVTFSIWPDTKTMANFARGDGPHGRAIQKVREQGWFSEELYARFRVLGSEGCWGGVDPLDMHDLQGNAA